MLHCFEDRGYFALVVACTIRSNQVRCSNDERMLERTLRKLSELLERLTLGSGIED